MADHCETKLIIETDEYILVSDKSNILYAQLHDNASELIIYSLSKVQKQINAAQQLFDYLLEKGFLCVNKLCCVNTALIKEYNLCEHLVILVDGTSLIVESEFIKSFEYYFETLENKLIN